LLAIHESAEPDDPVVVEVEHVELPFRDLHSAGRAATRPPDRDEDSIARVRERLWCVAHVLEALVHHGKQIQEALVSAVGRRAFERSVMVLDRDCRVEGFHRAFEVTPGNRFVRAAHDLQILLRGHPQAPQSHFFQGAPDAHRSSR
jgi:hypothetical protein